MNRLVGPFDRTGVRRVLLICDLFCGAGGFTSGAMRALRMLGLDAEMAAVNHWPVAIATHRLNHPEVRHYIEDVKAANPVDVVPERYLDVLLCSPSCVFFSRARGGRPTSDQQRMDPEAIIRWIDEIDVRILLLEEVAEFQDWCRVDPETGRPVKAYRGEYFRRFIRRIRRRGYRVEWRVLTCADYGDATSRRRLFIIARKDGVPIEWPKPTHSRDGGFDAAGRPLARWRGAHEIIDWSDRGHSIFGRRPRRKGYRAPKGTPRQLRALAYNTLRRVKAGTDRFTGAWRGAFAAAIEEEMALVLLDEAGLDRPSRRELLTFRWDEQEGAVRVAPEESRVAFFPGEILDAPGALGLVGPPPLGDAPWLVMLYGTNTVRAVGAPAPCVTAGGHHAALSRASVTARLPGYTCANRSANVPRCVHEPVAPVLTGTGGGLWYARPMVGAYTLAQQSCGAPRPVGEPVPSVATAGAISLAVPVLDANPLAGRDPGAIRRYLVSVNHGDDASGNNGRRVRDIRGPLQGLTGSRGFALLAPEVQIGGPAAPEGYVAAFFGSNLGRRNSVSTLGTPLRAVTTRARYGFCLPSISAYLVPQFGERPGQAPRLHPIDGPAPAVTSHGAGALVIPMMVRFDNAGARGSCVRSASEPIWTHTGKTGCGVAETSIIVPFSPGVGGVPAQLHPASPMPVGRAGGPWDGERSAHAPSAQLALLDEDLATSADRRRLAAPDRRCTGGRVIWVDGVLVHIDVAFRMLRNRELARSHSFDDEESAYEFVGTEAEQTRQVGNSVPVSTAQALVFSQIRNIPGIVIPDDGPAAAATDWPPRAEPLELPLAA